MEELTTFFIYTAWIPSHKWDVDSNGLIDYNGSLISPRELYGRFEADYPMFTIIRAEVCRRIINSNPEAERPYMWVDVERFQ